MSKKQNTKKITLIRQNQQNSQQIRQNQQGAQKKAGIKQKLHLPWIWERNWELQRAGADLEGAASRSGRCSEPEDLGSGRGGRRSAGADLGGAASRRGGRKSAGADLGGAATTGVRELGVAASTGADLGGPASTGAWELGVAASTGAGRRIEHGSWASLSVAERGSWASDRGAKRDIGSGSGTKDGTRP